MLSRRARPTLRVLHEDLQAGWNTPFVRRVLERGDLLDLAPLSELDHPVIAKALEVFGPEGDQDSPEGLIGSATQFSLWEVKVAQWRGGVWRDGDGACWLVAAGLAKGGHRDRDDFYERVARTHTAGVPKVGCRRMRTRGC